MKHKPGDVVVIAELNLCNSKLLKAQKAKYRMPVNGILLHGCEDIKLHNIIFFYI